MSSLIGLPFCLALASAWNLCTVPAQSGVVPASPSQTRWIQEQGKPDQFFLVYISLDRDPSTGLPRLLSKPRRIENWFYGSKGLRVMFDQGFRVSSSRFNSAILGSLPKSQLDPLSFDEQTTPADVVARFGRPDNTETASTINHTFSVYRYMRPGSAVSSFTFLDDKLVGLASGICLGPSAGVSRKAGRAVAKRKALLGIQIRDLTNQDRRGLLLKPEAKAVIVTSTTAGGPAARAGIRAKDLVVEFDGTRINTAPDLPACVSKRSPGETVDVLIWRQGQFMTLPVKLESQQ